MIEGQGDSPYGWAQALHERYLGSIPENTRTLSTKLEVAHGGAVEHQNPKYNNKFPITKGGALCPDRGHPAQLPQQLG